MVNWHKVAYFTGSMITLTVALVFVVALSFIAAEPVASYGGEGESCYPNKSCDSPNTCFRIRENFVCEKQISPAWDVNQPVCYAYQEGAEQRERCFETRNECISSFARAVLGYSKFKVIQGCGS